MREPVSTPAVLEYEARMTEFLKRRSEEPPLTDEEEDVFLDRFDSLWNAMSEDEAWSLNRRHALSGTPEHRAEVRANYAKIGNVPDWLEEP